MPAKKPLKKEIIKDTVDPFDYQYLNLQYYCEQCSHFKPEDPYCAANILMKPHLKDYQDQRYLRTGKLALCRFHEID